MLLNRVLQKQYAVFLFVWVEEVLYKFQDMHLKQLYNVQMILLNLFNSIYYLEIKQDLPIKKEQKDSEVLSYNVEDDIMI